MKRGLTYLASAMLALAVVLFAGAMVLPQRVHVERSAVVARPACTVYALVDGFARQPEWSPWAERDPAMQVTLEGPRRGVGAAMAWASEVADVGHGRQEITAASPCTLVESALQFGDMSPSVARFALAPEEGGTKLTWSIDLDMGWNPIGRVMGTQFDRWMGPDFEAGLAKLKALAEGLPTTDFAGLQVEEVQVAPAPLATVVAAAARSPLAVGVALGASYAQIEAAAAAHALALAGDRRASFEERGTGWTIRVSRPVQGALSADLPAPVRVMPGYGGPALKALHKGAADPAGSWAQLEAWAAAYGAAPADERRWAEYPSDPATTAPEQMTTYLYLPLKPIVRPTSSAQ
jgi:Polyketide cyclase / dehydrase and lipid transport